MSREKHRCEVCNREFEGYTVFVTDNFVEMVEWQRRKQRFDHLCEWCNHMYFQLDWHEKRELASEYSDKEVKTFDKPQEETA